MRFFNVYGPRQHGDSPYVGVISAFAWRMRQGIPPTVYGDGLQTRDFVYVEDVARALMLAGERKEIVGKNRRAVMNIASGRETTILELVALLNRLLGTNLEPGFEQAQDEEVHRSVGDNTRAREILG